MSKQGYILLHRSLMEHWIWQSPDPYSKREAWLYLLMGAAHTPYKKMRDGALIAIQVGELIVSNKELSEVWRWDRRRVKLFLDSLQNDDMIVLEKCTHKCSRLIVNNYAILQGKISDDYTAKRTPKRTPDRTPECTRLAQHPTLEASQGEAKEPPIKKGNKLKEKKEYITFPSDFSITDEMKTWAKEKLGDVSWLESETEQFVIYWVNEGTKRPGWEATWKTRMLKQLEYRGGKVETLTIPATGLSLEDIDPMFKGSK